MRIEAQGKTPASATFDDPSILDADDAFSLPRNVNMSETRRRGSVIALKDEFKGPLVIVSVHGRRGVVTESLHLSDTSMYRMDAPLPLVF